MEAAYIVRVGKYKILVTKQNSLRKNPSTDAKEVICKIRFFRGHSREAGFPESWWLSDAGHISRVRRM